MRQAAGQDVTGLNEAYVRHVFVYDLNLSRLLLPAPLLVQQVHCKYKQVKLFLKEQIVHFILITTTTYHKYHTTLW